MVQDKLIALIETLAEKSEAEDLEWEAAAGSNSYQINFPRYTVTIFELDDEEVPAYRLTITNERGELVETVLASNFGGMYQQLETVFSGARRKAMGVDSALDEILSSVVQQSFCKFVCSHVVSLFQVCAESGRREPVGRPQVPTQRRRSQAACRSAGPSSSRSAFSMLK